MLLRIKKLADRQPLIWSKRSAFSEITVYSFKNYNGICYVNNFFQWHFYYRVMLCIALIVLTRDVRPNASLSFTLHYCVKMLNVSSEFFNFLVAHHYRFIVFRNCPCSGQLAGSEIVQGRKTIQVFCVDKAARP